MTKPPISVNDAVARLVASHHPVLFCDTCALLDIVRLPARGGEPKVAARLLAAANAILNNSTAAKIHLVLPPLVRGEWDKNLPSVEEKTKKALWSIQNGCDLVSVIQNVRGESLQSITIPSDDVVQYLCGLGVKLVDVGTELMSDDNTTLRATDRAALGVAPATKGAIKDCLIYEHAISVMKAARQAGCSSAFVFLTSNTQDFCESAHPKEPIGTELTQVKAVLCTDWDWAYHELIAPAASAATST
jgi:hypothetical protein